MSNFFVRLYRLFHQHKMLFLIFSGILSILLLFFASRIRFEENISSVTGKGDRNDPFQYILAHFRFSDQLIIHFMQSDTLAPPDPGLLTSSASRFLEQLGERFDSSYIKSVSGKVSDTLMTHYYSFFGDHLPLYLNEKDYDSIESLLSAESVGNILRSDYKMLITPASFAMKSTVMKDPLGLTALAIQKIRSLQAGNYVVIRNGFIMTPDSRHLLLFITSANPVNETSKNTRLIRGIGDILKQVSEENKQQVKGEYFGSVAMAVGNASRLKKDIAVTMTIALILIVGFTGWYFKSVIIPILSFLPALFGGCFALAVLYLIQGSVSSIALGVGSVILGLIVDYALYIINHFRKKKS